VGEAQKESDPMELIIMSQSNSLKRMDGWEINVPFSTKIGYIGDK